MVVGAQSKPQAQKHHPEPSSEDDAVKRNTDCVYFLVSPVSCKKGAECEYRHSEHALYNPRDCWFWWNGNCLNLKCTFRHPQLEGLLGNPAASSAESSMPIQHSTTTLATNATSNSSKQAVSCIFFQRGFCSKGDKCPFSHRPNSSTASKVLQVPATNGSTVPTSLKKVFGGLQKCNQETKIPQVVAAPKVGVASQLKPAPKVMTAPPRNGLGIEKNILPTRNFENEAPRYEARSDFSSRNGASTGQASHYHQARVSENHGFQNGKDVDEHLRESSPGFDVLVDDELQGSDYYDDEEQFGRTRRNLNSTNAYDLDLPVDYNSIPGGEQNRSHDRRGYDHYDQMQGRYDWDHHRASSERLAIGPAHSERWGYRKSDSPDHIDGSDLRHRLSQIRRVINGPRSIISKDYDGHVEEQKNRPIRDSQKLSSREGSLSNRLRGRIKLPGGSSLVNGSDLRQEREARGRNRDQSRDRPSPRRPQSVLHQGRLRDRVRGRVQDDSNSSEGRNLGVPCIIRDVLDESSSEFSRPKSSSEPKPNNANMNNNQQSDGDLSFEGPMPLIEILKRKRDGAAASGSRKRSSVTKQDNSEKEGIINNPGGSGTENVTTLNSRSSVSKDESRPATIDTVATEIEKNDSGPGQPTEGQQEIEEGVLTGASGKNHELEGGDEREGEYDYEQGDDGEYYDEGENAEGEEEYLEEDGDDFAKKIGGMFS